NPEVIILDEPTLGIDPEGVRELLKLIKQLNTEQHITVLLSSHQLHQVQQICDRVGIFVEGTLLAVGNLDELASQLFFEDTYVIHAAASPVDQELLEKLRQLDGVNRVEQINETTLDIYCQRDLTSAIAVEIVGHGAGLHYISKKNYGLDEIYHRHFEGRDSDEDA